VSLKEHGQKTNRLGDRNAKRKLGKSSESSLNRDLAIEEQEKKEKKNNKKKE